MRALTVAVVLTAMACSLACTDPKWAEIRTGMDETEVRQRLGEPSKVSEDLAPPSVYAPRTPECRDTAKKVLTYERWSRRALLVYLDASARVACTEVSIITRSH